MSNSLLAIGVAAWIVAAALTLVGRAPTWARALLALGGILILVFALESLPFAASAVVLPIGMGVSSFELSPDALWLMG